MKISIVIPTYESGGRGVSLLNDLLNSICDQTYKDVEIVISDHSMNNEIENFVYNFKNLQIIYKKNNRGHGNSSINMNEGIKLATGDFIKIMHIDDFFCNKKSLELLVKALDNKDIKWGGFGYNHFDEKKNIVEREVSPIRFYYHNMMGLSSLMGCPSISFFINDEIFFDENLVILNDFDIYYNLFKKYGNPYSINDICITVRVHDEQVSNILEGYNRKFEKEALYIKNKYKNG